MFVRISVYLALLVCVYAHVIKHPQDSSTPKGSNSLDNLNKEDMKPHPVSTSKVGQEQPQQVTPKPSSDLPVIQSRVALQVGTCPLGYAKVGDFCVPEDY